MLLHIRDLLNTAELSAARELLQDAPWHDGRTSAGPQAAMAKNNEQLPEQCEQAQALRQILLRGLERSPLFFSAALPKTISPPMFNRYGGTANAFGNHVDSAVRFLPDGKGRVRTDVSCTVFLSSPEDYEGGELVVDDTYGPQRVKLAAGDMVLYPGTSVHRVEPVTRGHRLASFFWIQSMVREDARRALLFQMDIAIQQLAGKVGAGAPELVSLTGAYHNLLRMWAEV